MSTEAEREANIALLCRVAEEVFNRGNIAVAAEAFIPEIGAPLKQNATMLRAAFPDLHFTIEDALAVDDKVVMRVTVRCTHTGAPNWGHRPRENRRHGAGLTSRTSSMARLWNCGFSTAT